MSGPPSRKAGWRATGLTIRRAPRLFRIRLYDNFASSVRQRFSYGFSGLSE